MNEEKEERRLQWVAILRECAQYHNVQYQECLSPILGAEETEDSMMHKVWAMAIMDAVGLIEVLPVIEQEEEDEDGLPQHRPGPIG
tara:strand:- start:85 stop:342 length:258 start_codon:yes stop_codon:yes gene_type:complete